MEDSGKDAATQIQPMAPRDLSKVTTLATGVGEKLPDYNRRIRILPCKMSRCKWDRIKYFRYVTYGLWLCDLSGLL